MDKSYWPGCLLWHGWLPLLSGANGVGAHLGLGAQGKVLPVGFDAVAAAGRVAADIAGVVAQFQCRLLLLVQALILGDLAGTLGRYFVLLLLYLGGLRRFVPCDVGANHCRLRHIGWERCGHGLTSRPNELLVLFGYPCGSAAALMSGVLPLRYCSGRFACRVPTWSLPAHGHVRGLIAGIAGDVVVSRNEQVGAQLPSLVGGSGLL